MKSVNNLTINEENRLKTENTELKKAKSRIESLEEQVEVMTKEFRNFIASAVLYDKMKNPNNHDPRDLLNFGKKMSGLYNEAGMNDDEGKSYS
jgi:hypothetical protein